MLPSQLNRWTLVDLPRLNRGIMAGELPAGSLVHELGRVLIDAPAPDGLAAADAQRMIVHLSLAGASVARHYQEQDLARKVTPERAFDQLVAGRGRVPFQRYFAEIARATGTGHYDRDSYASLVRWNAPTAEVSWKGTRIAVLPGLFDDGEIRTYTGDRGERAFFTLLKLSEVLELAINDLLEPLSAGGVDVVSPEAVRRMRTATTLLIALRRLNSDFAAGGALAPEHFIDVFRQFAVHWTLGDIPPTGAQDPEFIKRDFLLGIGFPDYELLVRRIFPALLNAERQTLTMLAERRPLPGLVLAALGIDVGALQTATPAALRTLLRGQPALAACHLLLQANAKFAGTHLALASKFLFRPQDRRDSEGIPDNALVSNRKGTTGMTEGLLGRLTQARKNHVLFPLRKVPADDVAAMTGIPDEPPIVGADLAALVHFAPPRQAFATDPLATNLTATTNLTGTDPPVTGSRTGARAASAPAADG
ncbi:MAG: hypothetical protein JWO79_2456 [Actinomycetia bacterium]|nr:hypothetical protein [Actinomycetes bacterium]